MRTLVFNVFVYLLSPIYLGLAVLLALFARFKVNTGLPRLVWGPEPILNNYYWSQAMKAKGYVTETYTYNFYDSINDRENWDKIISEEYPGIPAQFSQYVVFLSALLRYDIFFLPVSGFFLGKTPLWIFEAHLFKIAKKYTVILPYGSDGYVYRRIRSTQITNCLLISYPRAARRQNKIAAKVDYWSRYADAVIPGIMGPDGFGRWDVVIPSILFIDLDLWKVSSRFSAADGTNETVYITHAPNHRGVKGTEFICAAVDTLKCEGLAVELVLLEKKKNAQIREILQQHSDIHVDQIIGCGYALNSIEAMASQLPVIQGLENKEYTELFRTYSFLDECPLVSASPKSLTDVLRKLVTQPNLRKILGFAGRKYVEKYHGLDSAYHLFHEVIEFVSGRKQSIINLYHPLLGDYCKRSPKIVHPLVENHLVD